MFYSIDTYLYIIFKIDNDLLHFKVLAKSLTIKNKG